MINGSTSIADFASATLYPKKMSVNTTGRFSIVQYEGTANTKTIPHGLSQRPDFILIKKYNVDGGDWVVWHKDLTNATATAGTINDHRIYLNEDLAQDGNNTTTWSNTVPTISVVTLGSNAHVNSDGHSFIMYCWGSVAGVSAFGTYTGGDSDDRTVTLGWEPRFVMVKRTDTLGSWHMFDTFRGVSERYLLANSAGAESTGTANRDITINSTGFVAGTDGNVGGSSTSNKFIYAAFA